MLGLAELVSDEKEEYFRIKRTLRFMRELSENAGATYSVLAV